MKKKWVIWCPWVKHFFQLQGGANLFFDDEADARKWAADANALFTPCMHMVSGVNPCKTCRYIAVPWDAQAQQIAAGGAT